MRHRNRTLCDRTDAVAMVSLYEDADSRCNLTALANKKVWVLLLTITQNELDYGQP